MLHLTLPPTAVNTERQDKHSGTRHEQQFGRQDYRTPALISSQMYTHMSFMIGMHSVGENISRTVIDDHGTERHRSSQKSAARHSLNSNLPPNRATFRSRKRPLYPILLMCLKITIVIVNPKSLTELCRASSKSISGGCWYDVISSRALDGELYCFFSAFLPLATVFLSSALPSTSRERVAAMISSVLAFAAGAAAQSMMIPTSPVPAFPGGALPAGTVGPNTAGFGINPSVLPSRGGEAVCVSGIVPVEASAMNLKFNYEAPKNQSQVTETFLQYVTQGSTFMKQIMGGMQSVNGTYQIGATLCTPGNNTKPAGVQILTHGVGFDRTYWVSPANTSTISTTSILITL